VLGVADVLEMHQSGAKVVQKMASMLWQAGEALLEQTERIRDLCIRALPDLPRGLPVTKVRVRNTLRAAVDRLQERVRPDGSPMCEEIGVHLEAGGDNVSVPAFEADLETALYDVLRHLATVAKSGVINATVDPPSAGGPRILLRGTFATSMQPAAAPFEGGDPVLARAVVLLERIGAQLLLEGGAGAVLFPNSSSDGALQVAPPVPEPTTTAVSAEAGPPVFGVAALHALQGSWTNSLGHQIEVRTNLVFLNGHEHLQKLELTPEGVQWWHWRVQPTQNPTHLKWRAVDALTSLKEVDWNRA